MNDFDDEAAGLVAALADTLRERGWRMATAESCTGGLIAGACTDLQNTHAPAFRDLRQRCGDGFTDDVIVYSREDGGRFKVLQHVGGEHG